MFYNVAFRGIYTHGTNYIIALDDEELANFLKAYEEGQSDFFANGTLNSINKISSIRVFNSSNASGKLTKRKYFDNLTEVIDKHWKTYEIEEIFKAQGDEITFEKIKYAWGDKKSSIEKKIEEAEKIANKIANDIAKSLNDKQKIFISHSSKDEKIVKLFCNYILGLGLGIDLQKDVYCTSLEGSKPKSGEDFKESIRENLVSAKLVLQFISKNYKKSDVCLNEMGAAWVLCDDVVPMVLEVGTYDVGFINASKQQVVLSNEKTILEFVNDKKHILTDRDINIAVLAERVKDFVKLMNGGQLELIN